MEFKPERSSLTAVVVLFLGAVPLGLTSPWLAPAFLVPLAALVWVLRARVLADPAGLRVCNGLGSRTVSWVDVDRFDLPRRGPVVLHERSGRATRLTALPRTGVKQLVAAGQPAPSGTEQEQTAPRP